MRTLPRSPCAFAHRGHFICNLQIFVLEHMSFAPYKLRRVKSMDNQFGVSKPVPTKFVFNDMHMGDTRTNCAQEFALSRNPLVWVSYGKKMSK
jgi:hypothetical protein